ncbi:MAG: RecQ family ATP-dependent DNA helicase [Treponema sp.]
MNIDEYSSAVPDGEYCPVISEWDDPIYSSERIEDAVAVCARTVFGIPVLYPWQRLVIANILDAVHAAEAAPLHIGETEGDTLPEDVEKLSDLYDEDGIHRGRQIVLLPTGAGKSLCFQVPALLLEKPTLIIYPLLALMSDQLRRMQEGQLAPAVFQGGQPKEERAAQYARLDGSDGQLPAKLIIANPEILGDPTVLSRIKSRGIAHLAIDEAHCTSEWGDSFRPAYLQLQAIIATLNPPAVTAFTATAGDTVLQRISTILFDSAAHIVRGETDRKNISYFVTRCRIKEPALLHEVMRRRRPAVVFCATRAGAERTAAFLRYTLKDNRIRFYHAGLQRSEKNEVEQWFHRHESAILVTTCAWGMGVDKKNVHTVIHLDPPPTAEAYTQEAGRGGRDGSPAEAVLLWSPEDAQRISRLPEQQRKRAEVLTAFAESGRCRREVLLEALGEKRAVPAHAGDESIACSGCDICSKTARLYPQDENALLTFVAKYGKKYTVQSLINLIHQVVPFWRAQDAARLIAQLSEDKKMKMRLSKK